MTRKCAPKSHKLNFKIWKLWPFHACDLKHYLDFNNIILNKICYHGVSRCCGVFSLLIITKFIYYVVNLDFQFHSIVLEKLFWMAAVLAKIWKQLSFSTHAAWGENCGDHRPLEWHQTWEALRFVWHGVCATISRKATCPIFLWTSFVLKF